MAGSPFTTEALISLRAPIQASDKWRKTLQEIRDLDDTDEQS